ncbi:MAG: 6-hydroxymethylpterin diphosphokinase MptE-like protein [Nitrososphaerota archaeon]|nr:DUF115 domain-containing protein [Candidatus Calditenuis fumarioli]
MDEPPFWSDEYRWITEFLGIDESADRMALDLPLEAFRYRPCLLPDARRKFGGKVAIVIGASESVLRDLEHLFSLQTLWEGRAFLVVADTATPLVLSRGIVPDVVVTDLDGPVDALLRASRSGSLLFVHAHGDNIGALRETLPLLGDRIEPTTQVPRPVGHVHNFGGFTDGDRAAYVSVALGARAVVLLGMCLTCGVSRLSSIGKSKSGNWEERKSRKLLVAARTLKKLAEWRRDVPIVDAGSMPSGVEGLPTMGLDEALRELLQ